MSVHDDNRMKGRPMLASESGQTMSEYAVVLLLLVPGAILVFTGLGNAVVNAITSVARLLP
jgi:Flp pilus assembly pilin Flp